jgi:hypothetical protein
VGQCYGAGFVDSVGKPTRGDKALVLENKEMGRMDAEVYGADMCNKPKGREGCNPWMLRFMWPYE